MPKVSVIMPSLNVAPYIRECMDSVVNQTLKDLEIICVDAGSTDGTWEILKSYAEKDGRVKLLHSDQKSYGYQMNLGLREAEGEYIGIVETDDYILPKMYEELYAYAMEHDADFVKSDFDVFTTLAEGERLLVKYPLGVTYGEAVSWEDYARRPAVDTFIWNGIYKRTFLSSNKIRFQETPGAAFQDIGFRYQVALSVKRGFFLKRSFYRYRRDNAGSSTYNSKCVLFNWSESQYILNIARKRGWTDHVRTGLLAKNIVQIAYGPYMEMLPWCKPADGTNEALAGFRGIIKDFINQGLLGSDSFTEDVWLNIRMFIEDASRFERYAHQKASAVVETLQSFLKNAVDKKQIVLFGSGQLGAAAYCTLQNNEIRNVIAFCDNDSGKWGKNYMECPVISPEEAIRQYPEAYFIIANRAHQGEIRAQLFTLGITEQRVTAYDLSSDPMFCTNMSLRTLLCQDEHK